MKDTKQNRALISLISKGYRVDEIGNLYNPEGKELKQFTKDGYKVFSYRFNGANSVIYTHRVQAVQKYGSEALKDGVEVRHKNSIRDDNSWDNILIGSHSDNMMDIPAQIRVSKAFHASSFIRKYNKDEIKAFHLESKSYSKTMKKFSISSKGTLNYILKS
jgi:hypothetical protein